MHEKKKQACRDVQKHSKTAVYSVHRGELDRAKELLDAAKCVHACVYGYCARDAIPWLCQYAGFGMNEDP